MKAVKALVSGKVQGVGFRMYTSDHARDLGVRGYVRNLTSGDVEIVAVGQAEAVNALIEWAKSGSPSAVVDNLSMEEITNVEEYSHFTILR